MLEALRVNHMSFQECLQLLKTSMQPPAETTFFVDNLLALSEVRRSSVASLKLLLRDTLASLMTTIELIANNNDAVVRMMKAEKPVLAAIVVQHDQPKYVQPKSSVVLNVMQHIVPFREGTVDDFYGFIFEHNLHRLTRKDTYGWNHVTTSDIAKVVLEGEDNADGHFEFGRGGKFSLLSHKVYIYTKGGNSFTSPPLGYTEIRDRYYSFLTPLGSAILERASFDTALFLESYTNEKCKLTYAQLKAKYDFQATSFIDTSDILDNRVYVLTKADAARLTQGVTVEEFLGACRPLTNVLDETTLDLAMYQRIALHIPYMYKQLLESFWGTREGLMKMCLRAFLSCLAVLNVGTKVKTCLTNEAKHDLVEALHRLYGDEYSMRDRPEWTQFLNQLLCVHHYYSPSSSQDVELVMMKVRMTDIRYILLNFVLLRRHSFDLSGLTPTILRNHSRDNQALLKKMYSERDTYQIPIASHPMKLYDLTMYRFHPSTFKAMINYVNYPTLQQDLLVDVFNDALRASTLWEMFEGTDSVDELQSNLWTLVALFYHTVIDTDRLAPLIPIFFNAINVNASYSSYTVTAALFITQVLYLRQPELFELLFTKIVLEEPFDYGHVMLYYVTDKVPTLCPDKVSSQCPVRSSIFEKLIPKIFDDVKTADGTSYRMYDQLAWMLVHVVCKHFLASGLTHEEHHKLCKLLTFCIDTHEERCDGCCLDVTDVVSKLDDFSMSMLCQHFSLCSCAETETANKLVYYAKGNWKARSMSLVNLLPLLTAPVNTTEERTINTTRLLLHELWTNDRSYFNPMRFFSMLDEATQQACGEFMMRLAATKYSVGDINVLNKRYNIPFLETTVKEIKAEYTW